MTFTAIKDPDSEEDFAFDWDLKIPGEIIATSVWELPSAEIVEEDTVFTADIATIRLSGGVLGELYKVTNRITTSTGQILDRSFTLYMKKRIKSVYKDPNAKEEFLIDWAEDADGDVVISSSWVVPAGLILHSSFFDTTSATAVISGGVLGSVYEVKNTITKSSGQILVYRLSIIIKHL